MFSQYVVSHSHSFADYLKAKWSYNRALVDFTKGQFKAISGGVFCTHLLWKNIIPVRLVSQERVSVPGGTSRHDYLKTHHSLIQYKILYVVTSRSKCKV